MKPHASAITLGVNDMLQARSFYADGLGWPIAQEYESWIEFAPSAGSSAITLHPRAALARDAGVKTVGGAGLSGIVLSYLVADEQRVDAILRQAGNAGGRIVRAGQRRDWGGYFGYFADPDGHLWKVTVGQNGQPLAE